MAFTFTPVADASAGEDMRIWDVVTDAFAGAGVLAHGLPFTPEFAIITPMDADCYTDQLIVTGIDATNVTFNRGAAAVAMSFRVVVGRTPSRA